MTRVERQLAAFEERLAALEQENRELKAAARPRPRAAVPKCPDAIREKIERELTPMQRMNIHSLAIDVQRYGYDQAMVMHGRALPKRGRKASH